MTQAFTTHSLQAGALALATHKAGACPLCVDLDGTLIKTDALLEGLCALLKQNVWLLFLLPLWLLRGRAHFKREVARRVSLDPRRLPYNEAFLDYLKEQRAQGRTLVLATASDALLAQRIAAHLGLFDEVIASDGKHNLKGRQKLRALEARFGAQGFDYAGNDRADLRIWPHARHALVVNARAPLMEAALRVAQVAQVFPDERRNRGRILLRAIRAHQWVKNVLVFIPLLTAHQLSASALGQAVLAFVAFSLCASSVYLLNDLADLDADRAHPTKRRRPLASGELPLPTAFALVPLLLLASVGVALWLPPMFLVVLACYFGLTVAYSLYLKQIALLDVLVLAILYTTRILAGSVAFGMAISPWLLAFSVFIFLSLAFVKRYSELRLLRSLAKTSAKGRGYFAGDLEQLGNLGAASGYISVLVLALYLNSEEVTTLYRWPELLWLALPPLLYWMSRVWLLAHRGQIDQDPVVFALHDRPSYYAAGAVALAVWLAL